MAELFQETPDPVVDPAKNYLEELVGEGKKFATPEELARGKAEADAFIARVTEENKALREEVQARATLQEFMDQMKAEREKNILSTPSNHDDQQDAPVNTNTITKETVESLINNALSSAQKQSQAERNLDIVLETLTTQYGPNVQTVIQNRAQELGLGKNYLTDLAKEQPKAFLALMGAEQPKTAPVQPATSARTNPTALKPGKRNFAYYEDLRKKDFYKYSSAAIHNEMLQALTEQGDDFYR